jgi:predicted nucleotidyltransferase component of viral defense system
MITFREIQKSYPDEINQSKFHQAILKEYFQFKMLEIIFNSKWEGNLIFLGGTNLRIIHNINRFSEDIDFDVRGEYTDQSHENLCVAICTQLEKEGYAIEIDKDRIKRNPAHTAFTRFINFPGLLEKMGLHDDPNKKFLIKIDAEAHKYGDFSYTPEIAMINRFDVFTSVKATPASIILSMKFCSILERSKGRDFYDIIALSGLYKADEAYIASRFKYGLLKEEYYGPVHLQEKILSAVATIRWDDKVKDLERFLFNENEAKKLLMFKSWISDRSFFKVFGLTYENGVLTDTRLMSTGKLRLNTQNRKHEISIPDDTKMVVVTSNRTCPDVKAGFKSTSGSMSLNRLGGSTVHKFEYSDKTKSIFSLELDGECSEAANFEVQMVARYKVQGARRKA